MNKGGRPRNLKSPDDLWKLWENFKQWCLENPLEEEGFYGPKAVPVIKKIPRPMTLMKFYSWIRTQEEFDAVRQYIDDPRDQFPEFVSIANRIKQDSKSQLSEYGLCNFYNANLTARIAGFSEKTENTTNISAKIADLFPREDEWPEQENQQKP